MKLILSFLFCVIWQISISSQEKLYYTFEFLKVDERNEAAYLATVAFWEGIHRERVKSGEIHSWDLWLLRPGGEDQGYQYLAVTTYESMVNMLKSTHDEDLFGHAIKAYPNRTVDQLKALLEETPHSGDVGLRFFLIEIDQTTDAPVFETGAVARINFMKAITNNYETMESMVFKPWHEKVIDYGALAEWKFLRVLFPLGSDQYASHMTLDIFEDIEHFVNSIDFDFGDNSVQDDLATQEGLKTRDHREVLLGTLVKTVR